MREILFRAKAINRNKGYHRTKYKNGDWVYGLVTRLYDERFENLPAEMTDINGVSGIEVDFNTIGQYTELNDENENKIFDGDIVRRGDGSICYVGYVAGVYRFFEKMGRYNESIHNFYSYVEVIGNIYDNPELLKGDVNE